jgi:hypothetical protein
MTLKTNGRPDYAPGMSIEVWEVNAERSQEWADRQRLAAEKHRRRMRRIGLVALGVIGVVVVVTCWWAIRVVA